ncbi:MAG: DUF4440 domain-containing protein [Gemmatimonadetes bacterium]|nr:DUF4440 domain-containing protein [Gemmatimonadota bacterium]
MSGILAFGFLTSFSLACNPQGDAKPGDVEGVAPHPGINQIELWKFELMREDRAFASSIRYQSFEAWSGYFAPDGSQIKTGIGEIRGPEAILRHLRDATASGAITGLTWGPNRAEVSHSGNLAYTVGEYSSSGFDADSVHSVVSGTYVSIWRRQDDGSWKVEMTLGSPNATPTATPGPREG